VPVDCKTTFGLYNRMTVPGPYAFNIWVLDNFGNGMPKPVSGLVT
jgi:hypothetical protein